VKETTPKKLTKLSKLKSAKKKNAQKGGGWGRAGLGGGTCERNLVVIRVPKGKSLRGGGTAQGNSEVPQKEERNLGKRGNLNADAISVLLVCFLLLSREELGHYITKLRVPRGAPPKRTGAALKSAAEWGLVEGAVVLKK